MLKEANNAWRRRKLTSDTRVNWSVTSRSGLPTKPSGMAVGYASAFFATAYSSAIDPATDSNCLKISSYFHLTYCWQEEDYQGRNHQPVV